MATNILYNPDNASSAVIRDELKNAPLTGLKIHPVEMYFGAMVADEDSLTKQVTISNVGRKALRIVSIEFQTDQDPEKFTLSGEIPPILKSGQEFQVGLTYVSTDPGLFTGLLVITTNESRPPYTVPVSGRILGSSYISALYGQFSALLEEERWARADADSAEAGHRLTLEASLGDEIDARVTQEQIARVTADSAEASARQTLETQLTTDIGLVQASVVDEQSARITADEAEAEARLALGVSLGNDLSATILQEQTARASADQVTADVISKIGAVSGDESAFVLSQTTVLVDTDKSLGTLLTEIDTQGASIISNQTAITTLEGSLAEVELQGAASSVNLLHNPNFEAALNEWSVLSGSWIPASSSVNGNYARITADGALLSDAIEAVEAYVFTLSGNAAFISDSGSFGIRINWYNGAGGLISSSPWAYKTRGVHFSQDMTGRLQITEEAPDNTATAKIEVRGTGLSGPTFAAIKELKFENADRMSSFTQEASFGILYSAMADLDSAQASISTNVTALGASVETLQEAYSDQQVDIAVLASRISVGDNIISKGTFDDGLVGNWSGSVSTIVDANGPYTSVLRLQDRDSQEYTGMSDNWLPYSSLLGSDRKFRFTGLARSPGSYSAQIGLAYTDGTGTPLYALVSVASAGSGWTAFDQIITLPAGYSRIRAALRSNGTLGAGGHDSRFTALNLIDVTDNEALSARTTSIANAQRVMQTKDEASAESLLQMVIQAANNKAAITSEQTIRSNDDEVIARSVTALTARMSTAEANITTEQTTRATADSAEAALRIALDARVTTAESNISTNAANITSEATARATADTTIAASVTSLTSTVGTNTANITTNTSSINGIAAKWGVEVDVNGRVTGRIKLDASGSRSNFIAEVDKFAIGKAGSSDNYPFEVSGGVVYMKNALIQNAAITTAKIADLSVDTIKIANQAVTIPVSSFTSGGISVSATTWTTIQTATITSTGAPIAIQAAYAIDSSNDARKVDIRIQRNGTTIWQIDDVAYGRVPTSGGERELHSFIGADSGNSGSLTYTVQVYCDDARNIQNRALLLTETKK